MLYDFSLPLKQLRNQLSCATDYIAHALMHILYTRRNQTHNRRRAQQLLWLTIACFVQFVKRLASASAWRSSWQAHVEPPEMHGALYF